MVFPLGLGSSSHFLSTLFDQFLKSRQNWEGETFKITFLVGIEKSGGEV